MAGSRDLEIGHLCSATFDTYGTNCLQRCHLDADFCFGRLDISCSHFFHSIAVHFNVLFRIKFLVYKAKCRMDHFENKVSSRQRDSLYSNHSDEESLSGFGREISKKRNALKSSGQEENLKRIDACLDDKAMDAARNETMEAKSKEEKQVKAKIHERKATHSKHERNEEKRKAVTHKLVLS